jgi:hypothetical protein
MKKITETELSAVAGGHAKHAKPSFTKIVKKIGDVTQSNSFNVTQVVADADVGGDLDMTAYAVQTNTNSGSIS